MKLKTSLAANTELYGNEILLSVLPESVPQYDVQFNNYAWIHRQEVDPPAVSVIT
jgi:hypothetical protein